MFVVCEGEVKELAPLIYKSFAAGSETYEKAIRDIKILFPEGVCCSPSVDLKAEEVCSFLK